MISEHQYEKIQNLCSKEIKRNEPMSKHTSFRIGGNSECFIEVDNLEELINIKNFAKENKIDVTIVGNGSNLLVSDYGIKGIVIKVNMQNVKIEEKENGVFATLGAGVKLAAIAQNFAKQGISGLEELAGIPGTIGGAIKMNAGAYGKEIKDVVISTKCLNEDNNIIILNNEQQYFSYRNSIFFKKEYTIVETTLKMEKKNSEEIIDVMTKNLEKRKESQPLNFPSAGSTFKRGNGFITAKEIDECGLKGFSIGGAQISTKHAGFIVNKGNATANDVLKLIDYVKKEVLKKKNLKIEEEVEFIGETRKDC